MSTTDNHEGSGTEDLRVADAASQPDGEAAWSRRVLLVDDHGMFREALGVVLEHHAGFAESVQARSLAQARQALGDRRSEFDLVVVDLDLPGRDGFELVAELRRVSPGIPVVAVTASPERGLRARALEAGASEVLATASSVEEIVATARRLGG